MSWTELKLSEVAEFKNGFAFKSGDLQNEPVENSFKVFKMGHIKKGGGFDRENKTQYVSASVLKDEEKYLVKAGDILMCMTDMKTTMNLLGHSAYMSDNLGFQLNQRVGLIRPKEGINGRYLYYYLNTQRYIDSLRATAVAGVQVNLSTESIRNSIIRAPSRIAQDEIVNHVSTFDDLIENNRRRIQLLEESARLLYQEWFVHLRFPGHEQVKITDGVPEGWVSGVVSDFFDTSSGGTPSRKVPEYYTGDIPWVKTQELNDGYIFTTSERITEEAIKKSSAKLFPAGTVLIAMYGATIGETGVLAVDAASNQACCALFPKHEELTPEFTHLFAKHSKQGLINLSQGAAQNNISQQVVRNYPFIMPSELLLNEFNKVVSNIYKQKANLEKQNASLAKARDLLLPKLMSGELTV